MLITRTSSLSGIVRTMELPVSQEQYDSWKAGALIQNAMPHLSIAEREFIKSGITSQEWDEAFGEIDEPLY
jgi:hypothetical protein